MGNTHASATMVTVERTVVRMKFALQPTVRKIVASESKDPQTLRAAVVKMDTEACNVRYLIANHRVGVAGDHVAKIVGMARKLDVGARKNLLKMEERSASLRKLQVAMRIRVLCIASGVTGMHGDRVMQHAQVGTRPGTVPRQRKKCTMEHATEAPLKSKSAIQKSVQYRRWESSLSSSTLPFYLAPSPATRTML